MTASPPSSLTPSALPAPRSPSAALALSCADARGQLQVGDSSGPGSIKSSVPLTQQEELKALVGRAALDYVVAGEVVGVGTGSTVNHFIDALAERRDSIAGAVSSSRASSERLMARGIRVFDAGDVEALAVYIDGADEIDAAGHMLKGGGAALTREKIVAALALQFVCIADSSKQVDVLGRFPLPVEVIPMAASRIARDFASLGGTARLRLAAEGSPLVTDNGQYILDVAGLHIDAPVAFEDRISQWPGVVTVGVFARQKAHVCLLGTSNGVQTLRY